MNVNTLSPSKMERIRLCEARVEAQLHDDGYDEDQGEPARIGILAHEAAKLWYAPVTDQGGNFVLDGYGRQTFRFTDPGECFRVAMEACTKKIDPATKLPKSENPQEISSLSESRQLFDQIISHYKREVLSIVFVERRYKGALSNGVPVHMIIDLAVDRGNGLLEVIDYKTGFIACTTEEMYDKDQVAMNLLAIRLDPQFQNYTTINFTYFWVKKGFETGPVSFSPERLQDYQHMLALEYKRILEIQTPSESLNRFCPSCGRRDQCTKYRKWVAEALQTPTIPTPEEMKMMDDDALMAQSEKIKGQIKTLEELNDRIKVHLTGEITRRQITELEGKTFKAVMRSSKHDSFNVQTVIALALEHKIDPAALFSVSKKQVETLLSDKPGAQQALNMTMKRGQTAPSLAITQIGVKRMSKPRAKKEATNDPAPVIQPAPGSSPLTPDSGLTL